MDGTERLNRGIESPIGKIVKSCLEMAPRSWNTRVVEVESWRNLKLSEDTLKQVTAFLYSFPRIDWSTARQFPPLSLVRISGAGIYGTDNRPILGEVFGIVMDYGLIDGQPYIFAAALDDAGKPMMSHNGRMKLGAITPQVATLVASCGPVSQEWMKTHLSDS